VAIIVLAPGAKKRAKPLIRSNDNLNPRKVLSAVLFLFRIYSLLYVSLFSFFCHFAHVRWFPLSLCPVPIRNLPLPGRSCIKVALIDHTSHSLLPPSSTQLAGTTLLRFFTAYTLFYINPVLKLLFFWGGEVFLTLEDGTDKLSWNVGKGSLRNSPERISHLLRGGSVKSRRLICRADEPVLQRKLN